MQFMTSWANSHGYQQREVMDKLSKQAVRDHKNTRIKEGNQDQAYVGGVGHNLGVSAQNEISNYAHQIPGVNQAQHAWGAVSAPFQNQGPGQGFRRDLDVAPPPGPPVGFPQPPSGSPQPPGYTPPTINQSSRPEQQGHHHDHHGNHGGGGGGDDSDSGNSGSSKDGRYGYETREQRKARRRERKQARRAARAERRGGGRGREIDEKPKFDMPSPSGYAAPSGPPPAAASFQAGFQGSSSGYGPPSGPPPGPGYGNNNNNYNNNSYPGQGGPGYGPPQGPPPGGGGYYGGPSTPYGAPGGYGSPPPPNGPPGPGYGNGPPPPQGPLTVGEVLLLRTKTKTRTSGAADRGGEIKW